MTTGFGQRVKRVLVGAGMLSAALVSAQGDGAAAQTLAALPMPSTGAPDLGHARPIVGWVEFCARYASECAVDPGEPAQVTLTPRLWHTVT
ncbi:transglutaminase-like cysteine peptidase, partial [Methylobacterium tarhaniae]